MGLTSALNTSLNGLLLNETQIDVLGHNISNAGTNGFKASEALFATQLSRTLSVGSGSTTLNGGTNPRQIGLGGLTTAIRKDFSQGSITNSTSPSDLAIQGDGFFILDSNNGEVYSRAGNFNLNSNNELVNSQGFRVQGYGITDTFEINTLQLTNISIPLGSLNAASETTEARFNGALLSTGDQATQGTQLRSDALTDTAAAGPITTASLLINVQDAGGNNLFTTGETLDYRPRIGERITAPGTSLAVTNTTTVAELLAFLDESIGIQSGGNIPNDGTTGTQPGITVTGAGEIEILGNQGLAHALEFRAGDLTSNSTPVTLPFTTIQDADGESTRTDFIAYDSLGQEVPISVTMVLESSTTSTTTFRYYITSAEDSDTDIVITNGAIQMDSRGQIIDDATDSPITNITINRDATAAISPQQIQLDFTGISGISTETAGSAIALQSQNGAPPGSLSSFLIEETGVIQGIFDNGLLRNLGQVILARFPNPQGLIESGDTVYAKGPGSGEPLFVAPSTFGTGTVRAGAIELSNTDIGENLVDLIVASTNYRGNARVISSVQELVDELLLLGR